MAYERRCHTPSILTQHQKKSSILSHYHNHRIPSAQGHNPQHQSHKLEETRKLQLNQEHIQTVSNEQFRLTQLQLKPACTAD